MNDHRHEAWVLQLSDYMDGDLDGTVKEALEAHLAECGSCRAVLRDLREIVARAGALEGIEPARDLWPGISEAMGGGGEEARVIQFPTSGRATRRPGFLLTAPQLAAASVALMLVSAGATWWAGAGMGARGPAGPLPAPAAEVTMAAVAAPPPELAEELEALEAVLAQARDRLAPETVRILEKNLGVIQRAIDESRDALAVDPANGFLRDHLQRAYRDKAAFLREVGTIVAWEG